VRGIVARLPGRELDILVAHGPGRSYGIEAGVLGVRFTGIATSGIVDAVRRAREARGDVPVRCLLTDLGNDILYRNGAERLLGWVKGIVSALLELGATVAITSLPVASIERIPPWKFRFLRPLFYPFRPMPQEEVVRQAREIQQGIEALSRESGVAVLEAREEWYGFDHFHLRRRARAEAMASWLDRVIDPRDSPSPRPAAAGSDVRVSALALRLHMPLEYTYLGVRRTGAVEPVEVAPGAWVSFY